MNHILLEMCCGSADDVIEAARGGADRAELCSSLFQGGLTPSIGTLEVVRERVSIPVAAMVRPREGGFCYSEAEYAVAKADARALIRGGADALVFGFLNPDGTVDENRTREMVELADGIPCVFHRAFDVVPDWKRAMELLIHIGITRILTSGQESDVFFALDTVAEMIRFAGDAIEVMPGAGITLRNVDRVVAETGCRQIHVAAHRPMPDTSVANNRRIYYGGALYPPEDRYSVTDAAAVGALRGRLDGR